MRCLHCSKKIGLLRRLVDRQFCCDAHRKRARQVYSARVARDISYEDSFEDGWIARANAPAPPRKPSGFGPGSGVLLVVLCTLLVMFLPSKQVTKRAVPESYLPPVQGLSDRISRVFPSTKSSISLREDFSVDMRNWQGLGSALAEWKRVGNSVRVGDLRLWKPTLALADYNMEFAGQIESRALGWAFRAKDVNNYYATKIAIDKSAGGVGSGRAEIIRYAVVNGRHVGRVELPIPINVSDNMLYEVKVRVRGDRFTTMVNGRTVDSWSDRRLRKGGVGFFNDPGERATLHWVSVSEKESFLQRFLSFSLLVHPSAWPLPEAGGD